MSFRLLYHLPILRLIPFHKIIYPESYTKGHCYKKDDKLLDIVNVLVQYNAANYVKEYVKRKDGNRCIF